MSYYTGTLIEESLDDKSVLAQVKILETAIEKVTEKYKTPWLSQWTIHRVEVPSEQAERIAQAISKALESDHPWYADFEDERYHYIIFRDKIFFVNKKNKTMYDAARAYGVALGIPEYQLDFHPEIKFWDNK